MSAIGNTVNNQETNVTFRIFSVEMDPDAISQSLKITPDHKHYVGDFPNNNPKYSPYKHAMWSLDSKLPEEMSLTAHLEALVDILESNSAYIFEISKLHTVDFYCTTSCEGIELPKDLIKRIAQLGADLNIGIFTLTNG